MSIKSFMKNLGVSFLWLVLCTMSVEASDNEKTFYAKFRNSDPQSRMALVVNALDEQVIRLGDSKRDIEKLFKGELVLIAENEKYSKAVVLFEPAKPPEKPLMKPTTRGWYICFRFNEDGILEDYFLSRRHPYWGHLM